MPDLCLVGDFLTSLETNRGNGARSRNTRLSAIRSFFKYVAVNEPQLPHHCQQVLAMPSKRYEKRTIDYLTRAEIEALIGSADLRRRSGRRDWILLLLAVQTGLRVSELMSDLAQQGCVVLARGSYGEEGSINFRSSAAPIEATIVKVATPPTSDRAKPVLGPNRAARSSAVARSRPSKLASRLPPLIPQPDILGSSQLPVDLTYGNFEQTHLSRRYCPRLRYRCQLSSQP